MPNKDLLSSKNIDKVLKIADYTSELLESLKDVDIKSNKEEFILCILNFFKKCTKRSYELKYAAVEQVIRMKIDITNFTWIDDFYDRYVKVGPSSRDDIIHFLLKEFSMQKVDSNIPLDKD